MLSYLKEFANYAEITGYRNIKFSSAEAFLKACRKKNVQNVDVQFFDAELIATQEHLYFAVMNALQAFKNETNVSKSLAMETMLYVSAQRQIQKAIQRCGIKPETTNMAVVLIGEDPAKLKEALLEITSFVGSQPDDDVLKMSPSKAEKIKEAFQISDEETETVAKNGNIQEALVNLVIEHVALLATQL